MVMPNRFRFPRTTPIINSPSTGGCPRRPISSPPSLAATMIKVRTIIVWRTDSPMSTFCILRTFRVGDAGFFYALRRLSQRVLENVLALFAIANADGLFYGRDEDLSVADLSASRSYDNRFYDLLGPGVGDNHIQFHLGNKDMIVPDARAKQIVEAIVVAARSGKIGDGKIFVSTIEEAIRIRNGEEGENIL